MVEAAKGTKQGEEEGLVTTMKGQVKNDRHVCEGTYLRTCICGMASCVTVMQKWVKFGAFYGCKAAYVQIPRIHERRKTRLQLYMSGYAGGIDKWADKGFPNIQAGKARKQLSHSKSKKFLGLPTF